MLEYQRLLGLRAPDAPITAEDLALLETPDEELYKRAYVFSFDVKKTVKRIERRRKWEQVIQAHLHLDHVVTQMLVEGLHRPDAINVKRLGFVQKLELLDALGLIEQPFIPALRCINDLRNKVAHDLDYKITPKSQLDLKNCTPKILRTGVLNEGKSGKALTFADLLLGNLVFLDVVRQKHAFERIRARKEAIHLRQAVLNARRVLENVDGDKQEGREVTQEAKK